MEIFDIILVHENPLPGENVMLAPVGLASIDAFLKEKGVRCRVIQAADIDQFINQSSIFGISVMDHFYREARYISQRLKDKTVIWGGWTATALPETILKENPCVDYVILQDGEQRLYDLWKSFTDKSLFEKIDGIAFRNKSGDIVVRPPQEYIDLDDLPRPTDLAVLKDRQVCVEISRGCYGGCHYCQEVKKMRFKSVDHVVKEIVHWNSLGYRTFMLGNANALANGVLLKSVIEKIESLKLKIRIRFACRPDDVLRHKDVVEHIFKSEDVELDAIEVGIEANSQALLDLLGRSTTPEVNRSAIAFLKDLKAKYASESKIHANIILFAHWNMALSDFIETIKFIGDYQCSDHSLTLMLLGLAGTPLWHEMKELGFSTVAAKAFQIVDYPFMDDRINRLFKKLIKTPMLLQLLKMGVSAFNREQLNQQCRDKLYEFYHSPDIEDALLTYIES